jgi:hypothetical protein
MELNQAVAALTRFTDEARFTFQTIRRVAIYRRLAPPKKLLKSRASLAVTKQGASNPARFSVAGFFILSGRFL